MKWNRRHVLDTDDWSRDEIETVLDQTRAMIEILQRPIRRAPPLRGRTVILFFAESSTRTRVSFELAAKALSADVTNITASGSSVEKGESLYDTVRTLQALGGDVVVMRHASSGAPYFVAERTDAAVINAGDGWHAHPTQGLLDAYTLRDAVGDLEGKRAVIVGDVLHSRVARSDINTLVPLGARITLSGPPTLIPMAWRCGQLPPGVTYESDLDRALDGADAVIALRLQRERQESGLLPSLRKYSRVWGLTADRVARMRPGAPVMHPGPMNEGIEIDASDSPGLLKELLARGKSVDGARVRYVAAITRGRKGRELSDMVELAAAGAIAFSDDGSPVEDSHLFRSALEYARVTGRPVIEHAQDLAPSAKGVMHEGSVSARLGLPGMPAAAEESAVARDIALARMTGANLHLTHLSTAGSIELVRRAKADGVPVTCDVTPHHLAMTDEWVAGSRALAWEVEDEALLAVPYDSSTKVNPPLRGRADVRALWAGLVDGTVDAIATDHAPHASVKKDVEFDQAAFGISGLETALALVLGGVGVHWAALGTVIDALTLGPARVLGSDLPRDDWAVIDRDVEWIVRADELASKGKNTPLIGRTLTGRVVATVVDGELRYEGGARVAEAVSGR